MLSILNEITCIVTQRHQLRTTWLKKLEQGSSALIGKQTVSLMNVKVKGVLQR